jgi:hypothetical protein
VGVEACAFFSGGGGLEPKVLESEFSLDLFERSEKFENFGVKSAENCHFCPILSG